MSTNTSGLRSHKDGFCPSLPNPRGPVARCTFTPPLAYRDGNGTVKRRKGFADLKATEQLAAETERKASRVRSGYTDPAEEHARRPLADHLKDYAAHFDAKGNCPEHNRVTVA